MGHLQREAVAAICGDCDATLLSLKSSLLALFVPLDSNSLSLGELMIHELLSLLSVAPFSLKA